MPFENVTKASRLISRLIRIAVANPRGLRPILGTALAASETHLRRASDPTQLPSVRLEELLEGLAVGVNVQLFFRPKVGFSINLFEALGLASLVRLAQARRIFEFGTYRGISSSQLALNLPADGKLFTLDLPPGPAPLKFDLKEADEIKIAHEKVKGDVIPSELLPRIEFLHADSAVFDETPYLNSMDLVFVDGAHTFEYVQNDSQKGWRMLRSGGFMAWHDCRAQTPDVVNFLVNSSYRPRRIEGTSLAFAQKPEV
jgi:hypothetical protein